MRDARDWDDSRAHIEAVHMVGTDEGSKTQDSNR